MPGTLIFVIILTLFAAIAAASNKFVKKDIKKHEEQAGDRKPSMRTRTGDPYAGLSDYGVVVRMRDILTWVFRGCLGLAALLLVLGSIVMVGTKEIGIVTTFGKPTGHLSNGVHLKWPWQKVTEIDGAIQTDNNYHDPKAKECTSTNVRLANQSTACVDNSIRWRVKEVAGDALFRDYRGFDNIRDSLVTRQLNASINNVLSKYNPLASLKDGQVVPADIVSLADDVKKDIDAKIGTQIDVISVILPFMGFDKGTQDKINLYQAAIADTRIAAQRELTANNQAQANKNLADSVSRDPNVLVSQCFDTLADMVKEHVSVPAGFSCWPGGGGAVVVPATK